MAKFKVSGVVYRWGSPDIKRTRTIEASTDAEAKNIFSRDITIELGKTPRIEYCTQLAEKETVKTSDKLNALPEHIRVRVKALLKGHRINKFGFRLTNSVYLEEDATYTVWSQEGGWNSVRMGGEWGGYKTGVAGAVAQTVPLPVGAFVIEDEIFCGKYIVTVYHNNGIAQVGR